MSDKVLVATYGSLRRGMSNEGVNNRADATYVGKGKTVENFDLFRYNSSYFPSVSLIHSESQMPVVVDVWETTMKGLTGPYDFLEGYPSFYNRSEIDIAMDDGSVVRAWIYHIDTTMSERVEHGDWCVFVSPAYYDEV